MLLIRDATDQDPAPDPDFLDSDPATGSEIMDPESARSGSGTRS